jgi:hypothetical protein
MKIETFIMMMIKATLPKHIGNEIEKNHRKRREAEENLEKKTKFVTVGGPYETKEEDSPEKEE